MVSVETTNAYAAKWTIAGWLVGLAYYNWFATKPPHVPLWVHAVLLIGGIFVSSIIIGGGVAIILGGITKLVTGRTDDSTIFAWGVFISPVIAFIAAKYALLICAGYVS